VNSNNSGKKLSVTRETERGYFIRTKVRHGKKRHQKTIKLKPSHKKVIIDQIADLQIYVYPKDYPDKVFLGIYPMSTMIGEEDYKRLFGILNKIRWYFDDQWVKHPKREKGAKFLRRRIVNSYNLSVSELKKPKTSS